MKKLFLHLGLILVALLLLPSLAIAGGGLADNISGTITRSTDSSYLSNISVTVKYENNTKTKVVLTNTFGFYQAGAITNGTYTATPALTGYTFNPINKTGNHAGGTVTAHFSAIPNKHTISGTITDGVNPIAGVIVHAGTLGQQTTDVNGTYTFTNVDYDSFYTITPSMSGWEFNAKSASGTINGNKTHNFTGARVFGISGSVTRNGSPLVGVTINGGSLGTTATNNSGSFYFVNVLDGTNYTLTPSLSGHSFTPSSVSSSIAGANASHAIVATIDSYTLSGTVSNGGSPLSGATVDGGSLGIRTTNALGTFSYTNVPHGTSYSLATTKSGLVFGAANGTVTGNTTVAIVGSPTLHSVSGQVVVATLNGSGLPNVVISDGSRQTITDNSGNYTLTNVPYGTHTLTATLAGFHISADIGTNPVTVAGADHSGKHFSATPVLDDPLYVFWNGFLDVVNIIEIVNKDTENTLTAIITLYPIAGIQALQDNTDNTLVVNIAASTQRDIILNNFSGFEANSFGVAKIEFSHSNFDGRTSYYRVEDNGIEFDFAFSLSFTNPLYGESAVTYNANQPSLNAAEAGNLVAQWFTVVNLNEVDYKVFTIRRFDILGNLVKEVPVILPPLGRIDIEGGHEGGTAIGLNKVFPSDSSSPYLAKLSRFGNNAPAGYAPDSYSFAFAQMAQPGIRGRAYMQISHIPGDDNFVEVVNTLSQSVGVTLTYFDQGGSLRGTSTDTLAPLEHRHYYAGLMLDENKNGMIIIEPSVDGALIASSMVYFRDDITGSIESIESTQAREIFGNRQVGSYNLFLGMDNKLRLINVANAHTAVTVSVETENGIFSKNIILAPNARVDLSVRDYLAEQAGSQNAIAEGYGMVTVESSTNGAILTELIRIRPDSDGEEDFRVATQLR